MEKGRIVEMVPEPATSGYVEGGIRLQQVVLLLAAESSPDCMSWTCWGASYGAATQVPNRSLGCAL